MKPNRMTFKDAIELGELLKSVVITENGVTRYQPKWNDDAVAKKSGYANHSVKHLRAQLFPNFFHPTRVGSEKKTAEIDALKERITDLELRLKRLEDSLGVTA